MRNISRLSLLLPARSKKAEALPFSSEFYRQFTPSSSASAAYAQPAAPAAPTQPAALPTAPAAAPAAPAAQSTMQTSGAGREEALPFSSEFYRQFTPSSSASAAYAQPAAPAAPTQPAAYAQPAAPAPAAPAPEAPAAPAAQSTMQTSGAGREGLGQHVTPAAPAPPPDSLGAQVNAPFQPGVQQPAAPTFQMPSAQEWNQANAQAQNPSVTAPTPSSQPFAQQSRPVMTGAGASTFASTPVAAATWQAGNMAGGSHAAHAPLPGLTQRTDTLHSDFGRPTAMEKLTPDQQHFSAANNHFGWGGGMEDATRNRMNSNTDQMHQIGAGRGGMQHGADGSTQFFNRGGNVTAAKTVDNNGTAHLRSDFGTGKATFSPDARRGIDWSKGSVRDGGQPWKPKMAGESQQAFLERMLLNAPEILS